MKQEILCPKCAEDICRRFGLHKANYPNFTRCPYQGEHIKLTWGIALNLNKCDHCAKDISVETKCAAFSIWTDKIPFIYGWEERYIDPLTSKMVTIAAKVERCVKGRPV